MTPGRRALEHQLLVDVRRATLATIDPAGRPRLVPVCFVLDEDGDQLWIPLDAKPKRVADPRSLARVRDILERPAVTVLVDRWSEDWSELAWLRLGGEARLVEAGEVPAEILRALVDRYPQYGSHDLGRRPAIVVTVRERTSWSATPSP